MLSLRDAACSENGTGTRSDLCHYLWLVLCSETGTGIRSGLYKFQLLNLLEGPFLSVTASYTTISTILHTSRAGNSVFLARNARLQFFFWLPKRVNRDISCIATKVRKLQIYPFSFQHTRLEYRPPLASKIQMEIHDTHIYVEHIYIYAYCTSPGPI